jgi:hypothetical protein
MAAAGQAEILAMRLADDGAAGIKDAGHDGGVDVRHVALERRRTVHHRHAGQHDVVLQHDGLALELAARGAFDRGLDVPGIVLVLVAGRAIARRARIFHPRQVVGHGIDDVVGRHARPHQLDEGLHVGVGQRQADIGRDFAQLLFGRDLNAMGSPPSVGLSVHGARWCISRDRS